MSCSYRLTIKNPAQQQALHVVRYFMSPAQEKYIFESFKELYKDFPEGTINQSDKPDYIIALPNKTIGVEITQVLIDNDIDSRLNEKRRESLKRQLGQVLCSKLEAIVTFKYLLSVDFSDTDFASNEINQIVKACETCIHGLQFPEHDVTSVDITNYGQLPAAIDNLNFYYYPKLKESFYVETAGGAVPNLTTKHLQIILNKKESSLKNYQLCDEYWLLIEEGTFKSDSFDAVEVDDLITTFTKIFIYRHSNNEIVQVK